MKRYAPLLIATPFAILFIAKSLATFAVIIQGYLRIHYDLWFELGMVTGQIAFQWIMMWKRTWTERVRYAFVLLGVSLLGAALLWPMLGWHLLIGALRPLIAVMWFFGVVGVMFLVHAWLVKKERLPLFLCATWVVYRLLILVVALKRPG